MRIILKQDVENLGRKGDIVNVAPGYGRNYLIPNKLAIEVTPSNMKMINIEQKALKKALEKERASYQELIEKLNQVTITFRRKTGEKDVIFGSVSASDIKEALHELGYEVDKKKILLDDHIKRLGNYTVPIKIFHEEKAEVKVEVVKEGEEGIEEEAKEEVVEKEEEAAKEMREPEEKIKEVEEKEEEGKEETPDLRAEEAETEGQEPEKEEQETGENSEGEKKEAPEGETEEAQGESPMPEEGKEKES